MRELILPESGVKRKLLDVAEALVAWRGFESVSVRDITQAAKMNVAAVNYHFGDRDTLLTLAMMRPMMPVAAGRLEMLDAAERKSAGTPLPLEEILHAFTSPLVTQAGKSGLTEPMFYKLCARIFAREIDGLPEPVASRLGEIGGRFANAFARTLPALAPAELSQRIHFLTGSLIYLLAARDKSNSVPMPAAIAGFIRFAAAGLSEGVATPAEITPAARETPPEDDSQTTFGF